MAIFTRKLGGEVSKRDMHGIINILPEKGFFDKESYEKYHILTSVEIQRIWLEQLTEGKGIYLNCRIC